PPEEFNYTSFDGKKIQAWIQKPPDFDPHKKYPLILDIHGGPHAAYGWVFDHEFQWMAAKGYVVLYPNPRGSTSYGQEFGNIIQYHYPGDDYRDLMIGVDELLKRATAMVIFPRETHELSRSGEPWHRIERLDHIMGWFDKWLMGVPHPEYDIRPEKQVEKTKP